MRYCDTADDTQTLSDITFHSTSDNSGYETARNKASIDKLDRIIRTTNTKAAYIGILDKLGRSSWETMTEFHLSISEQSRLRYAKLLSGGFVTQTSSQRGSFAGVFCTGNCKIDWRNLNKRRKVTRLQPATNSSSSISIHRSCASTPWGAFFLLLLIATLFLSVQIAVSLRR